MDLYFAVSFWWKHVSLDVMFNFDLVAYIFGLKKNQCQDQYGRFPTVFPFKFYGFWLYV